MMGAPLTSDAEAARSSVTILNESSNARIVTVSPGQHLTLVLHSTYWSVATPAMPRQLIQIGSAKNVGRLPSATSGCVALRDVER